MTHRSFNDCENDRRFDRWTNSSVDPTNIYNDL